MRRQRPELRQLAWGLVGVALLAFAPIGCSKPLNPQDYGEIIFDLPKIEGADVPIEFPELGETKEPKPL